MNLWIRTAVLACVALAAVAEPLAVGTYRGKYEGSSGSSGDFQVTLAKGAGGEWTGSVLFTLSGQEVKCKVTSVKIDGDKLKMVYSFDLQGTMLESTIDGALSDGKLGGKYRTQVTGDGSVVDEGSWSTTSGS